MAMNVERLFASEQLVRTRLVMMLSYYIDIVYGEDRAGLASALTILFKGLGMESSEKAFALQCTDTIKVFLEYNSYVKKFPGLINELLPCVFALIPVTGQVLSILSTVASNYKAELGDASQLVQSLLGKVRHECEVHSKKSSMAIVQSLRIVDDLAQAKETAVYVEMHLKELCYYLSMLELIEFEDEIIGILWHYMKSAGKVFELFGEALRCLPQIYKKCNKHMSLNLFALMSCGFTYAQEIMRENLELVFDFILEVMATKLNEDDTGRLQGALLIQLLMQMPWGNKMDASVPIILKNALGLLKIESDIVTRQQLVNILLIATYGFADIALPILKENSFNEILAAIAKAQLLSDPYNMKAYVLGVTCLLSKANDPALAKSGPEMLAAAVKALSANYKEAGRGGEESESEDGNCVSGG